MFIIIGLILYGGSVYYAYKFVQLAYSKGGIWQGLNADGTDVFFTIMPLFNLGNAFAYLMSSYEKIIKN